MTRTVASAFHEFGRRIEPTDKQKADARARHGGVRSCLERKFFIDRAFLTGSYARSTMIRPPSDIDLFVILDSRRHGNDLFRHPLGSARVLEQFHRVLKDRYPLTPVRKDRPAVNLDFVTYGFDVTPAFRRAGGGYFIPSRYGSGWVPTNPGEDSSLASAMNTLTDGVFIPLVKMLKSWNASHGGNLTGYHLELAIATAWPRRIVNTSKGWALPIQYPTLQEAAAAVLATLPAAISTVGLPDPSGLGGPVDGYLKPLRRLEVTIALSKAARDAQVALRHEARGMNFFAIPKWRSVFGEPFPAP